MHSGSEFTIARTARLAPVSVSKEQPPPNPPGGTWSQAQPGDELHKGKWWEIYGDPKLNSLEEQVAVSNQTLLAATQRYLEAREQIRVVRADMFPTLSVGASASREQLSQNRAVYVLRAGVTILWRL